ncbi:MAG: glycoside hydrolase family 15 protein [Acidimicrobiales bacterium]|jgi:GH15 family glucan-1,4-alpha-glucosidase
MRSVADVPVIPATHVLRDYALLADGHRGVLVGPQGDCTWLCFPGWSDPAVFAALVGSGGHYLIQPKGRWVWGGYYEDGTLIWTSRWVTEDGIFESREALCYPATRDRAVLLRRVRALDTPGELLVALDPRSDYGRQSIGTWRRRGDCWEVRGDAMVARWWGGGDAVTRQVDHHQRLELELELKSGGEHDFVLELMTTDGDTRSVELEAPDPEICWRLTEEAWRTEVPRCEAIVAAQDVRRSYAVLRGMTGPEGGTVAAATTSLPERARGNRNYDYRYVWVRDTCYVGRAGAAIPGGEAMLDDAVRWVTSRLLADGDRLAPAYLPDGSPVPRVEVLDDLPGYPGGTDVIGNHIGDQFQLDAFGEALLLFALAASRGRLDANGWQAAEIAAAAIEGRWTEPDSGIWELEPKMWTHSRLICVAGLRALCEAGTTPEQTVRYLGLADTIMARVANDSVHPSGRWQRADDDPRVDASLLLAQIRGAVPDSDPRSEATRRAVADELSDDGYVYRYGHPGLPLGEAEGAFLICNFWLALASIQTGETTEGLRWFERARAASGSPGLFAEEYDVVQHQLRGNLPQAFVHGLLIECAAAQSRL